MGQFSKLHRMHELVQFHNNVITMKKSSPLKHQTYKHALSLHNNE